MKTGTLRKLFNERIAPKLRYVALVQGYLTGSEVLDESGQVAFAVADVAKHIDWDPLHDTHDGLREALDWLVAVGLVELAQDGNYCMSTQQAAHLHALSDHSITLVRRLCEAV